MGAIEVPADRYWGAQTQRSLENFPIGVDRFRCGRPVIRALGVLKKGAALANGELGQLPPEKVELIVPRRRRGDRRHARRPLPAGRLPDRLRHADQHERQRGDREPRDRARRRRARARRSRSTRTTTSTAASRPTTRSRRRCTSPRSSSSRTCCCPRSRALRDTLDAKAEAYADIVKIGRTHLQDATPITLGQEISRLGGAARPRARRRRARRCPGSTSWRIGGTAVGTGLNAHPQFGERRGAQDRGRDRAAVRLGAEQVRGARGARRAGRRASGALRTLAGALMKIANDVRWLASGPALPASARSAIPENEPGSLDHAGQGQPDAVRGADDGLRAGVRQRRRGGVRRLAGQLRAERLQAGDGAQRARVDPPARRRVPRRSTTTARVGIEPNRERIDENLDNAR